MHYHTQLGNLIFMITELRDKGWILVTTESILNTYNDSIRQMQSTNNSYIWKMDQRNPERHIEVCVNF